MTPREIEVQAKDRALACAEAIQLQLGLGDRDCASIERLLKREFRDAMREARERE